MPKDKVCVVIGAGDATGGAIARRFAREGYTAVVTRRSADKLKHLVAQMKTNGELNEATLLGFAKQRKYEESVAALAQLSRSTIDVIRPLMQSLRDDGVLVACRAAELSWETVSAVLESRFSTGSLAPHELAKAQGLFAKITTENARRLLRFWQVRAS